MIHTNDLLAYDIELIFHEKIVDISHNTCGGILNRKHCVVCLSVSYILHGCTPCFYMVAFNLFTKVLTHCCIAVCTFHALKNNCGILKRNVLYSCEITLSVNSVLCQKLVLSLAADCHDLAKKLLHAKTVELSVRLFFQCVDLLTLTNRVQNLLACLDLIFSDFFTHLHSFFKETHDLAVNLIDLVSVSFQISHYFLRYVS